MSNFSQLDDLLKIITGICKRQRISLDSVSDKLNEIKARKDNPLFCIGVAGEYNTGKSTFVNAIVGYPLFVAGSTQGTTMLPTFIEYAPIFNLCVEYVGGKRKYYNCSKSYLLRRYVPKIYRSLSIFQKIIIFWLDAFGKNVYDKEFGTLLEAITTTNYEEIQSVFVQCPSERLKQGLVLVDMPGMDSLLYTRHKMIASIVLKKCDMVLITVSPQKNLNEELISFIRENNLIDSKRIQFFLTMVDLIKNKSERDSILRKIAVDIHNKLGVNDVKVIPSPTLLYLEAKRIVSHNSNFGFLISQDRKQLVENLESDLNHIFSHLGENQKLLIYEQLIHIVRLLVQRMESTLNKSREEDNKLLIQMRNNRTIALNTFLELNMNFDYSHYLASLKVRLETSAKDFSSSLRNAMYSAISSATTKDATQEVFKNSTIKDKGAQLFDKLYNVFLNVSNELFHSYESEYITFSKRFQETYNLNMNTVDYKTKHRPINKIHYRLIYSTSGMTTNPLFRCFKKLETIKKQVRDVVDVAASETFNNVLVDYINSLNSQYRKMNTIRNQFLMKCTKKYSSLIDDRIMEEGKKIKKLDNEVSGIMEDLSLMQTHLQELKKIVDKISLS